MSGGNTMAKYHVTDRDILAQIPAARARERYARQREPRALAATYDRATERIHVDLIDGGQFAIPVWRIPELRHASIEDVEAVEVSPSGEALHWERLNADYRVPKLLITLIGPTAWKSELARIAGRVSSPRKRRAAKKNGAKGGRPRKRLAPVAR
jgi:uncharacterized protein DUF2442